MPSPGQAAFGAEPAPLAFGELYPVLGDAMIIAARVLSFGLLDWPAAYALGFTVVFLTQGWGPYTLNLAADHVPARLEGRGHRNADLDVTVGLLVDEVQKCAVGTHSHAPSF